MKEVLVESVQQEVALKPAVSPMTDYYGLQKRLYQFMAGLALVLFPATCLLYSFSTGLSYLLGALTGMLYFHLLSKSVASLGRSADRVGKFRLLIVALVFAVAFKLRMLELVPIFLGFLTFKAAILLDAFRSLYQDALR